MRLIDEPTVLEGTADAEGVQVHVSGAVDREVQDDARMMIRSVLVHHGVPLAGCRIRLSALSGETGRLLVQVTIRVCGAPARMQVEGPDASAAIATAVARLHRHITVLSTRRQPWSWPDPQRRPSSPHGSSSIARVKNYRLQVGSPCQAAATLFSLDYDAHLYTDAETGQDAVIYRCGPTGLRMARQRSMHPPSVPAGLPLTINSRPVPVATPAEAAQRLTSGWLPFLFFTDRHSGRGHLCYRRYDGAVGLIRPVAAASATSTGLPIKAHHLST